MRATVSLDQSLNRDRRRRKFERRLSYEGIDPRQQRRISDVLDTHEVRLRNSMSMACAASQMSQQLEGLLDYTDSDDGSGSGEEEDEFDSSSSFLELSRESSLRSFVELEKKRNGKRNLSRQRSETTLKITAWHQRDTLRKALHLAGQSPYMAWLSSFYRRDPRWQISRFFDEVAREGGDVNLDEDLAASPLARLFNRASVFTVWRPTSNEAIKNMMMGHATGKGLDIKGKSAKCGNISSYVPFVQIYEDAHKEECRAFLEDGGVVRIFYQNIGSRDEAYEHLLDLSETLAFDESCKDNRLDVEIVGSYSSSAKPVFGLDVSEFLFWEAYVMRRDCSRPRDTEWHIRRDSLPAFMEMNLDALRRKHVPGAPRAVVYQMRDRDPMETRTLLMAYDECGGVKPVVSDFDCFIIGSRNVRYEEPIPPEQVELVQWSVRNIGGVLDERARSDSQAGWTQTWIETCKGDDGYHPVPPKYGFGDPRSYEIIEVAVSRLQTTGCVRHGAECFNWYFPQEIDDEFLVISDTLPGTVKWKKVNVSQLQELLMAKIDEGFTFPINPKWVLCDPGWRRVYDRLLGSGDPNVRRSVDCWLPPGSGIREEIDAVSRRHPGGFTTTLGRTGNTRAMMLRNQMEKHMSRRNLVRDGEATKSTGEIGSDDWHGFSDSEGSEAASVEGSASEGSGEDGISSAGLEGALAGSSFARTSTLSNSVGSLLSNSAGSLTAEEGAGFMASIRELGSEDNGSDL